MKPRVRTPKINRYLRGQITPVGRQQLLARGHNKSRVLFKQSDSDSDSTWIDLALARGIVKMHGERIQMQDEAGLEDYVISHTIPLVPTGFSIRNMDCHVNNIEAGLPGKT